MVFRKVRYWIGGVSLAAISLAAWVFWPLINPPRYPCTLPSLEPAIPSTTVSEVGAGGHYRHACPVPLAQEMLLERSYGAIQLQLWGSPHRLYMRGTSTDGRPLAIRGPRAEAFDANSPESFLSKYTDRVTFADHDSVGYPLQTAPETFGIDVYDGHQWLEEIELRYAPKQCECVVPF